MFRICIINTHSLCKSMDNRTQMLHEEGLRWKEDVQSSVHRTSLSEAIPVVRIRPGRLLLYYSLTHSLLLLRLTISSDLGLQSGKHQQTGQCLLPLVAIYNSLYNFPKVCVSACATHVIGRHRVWACASTLHGCDWPRATGTTCITWQASSQLILTCRPVLCASMRAPSLASC